MNKYRMIFRSREFILAVFTVVFFLIMYFTTNFSSIAGIQSYLRDVAFLSVAGVSMTVLFLTGNTDLSMGTTMGLAGFFAAYTAKTYGAQWYIFIPVAIVVGVLFASINGIIITKFKVPAMVASLALMTVHMGVFTLLPSGGWVENMAENFTWLGYTNVLTVIPVVFLIAITVVIGMGLLMKYSRFSKKIYAVGGNPNAARLAGIKPGKTVFIAYLLAGGLVGIASVNV